jgi:UDP-glucuronate 4-epimerase
MKVLVTGSAGFIGYHLVNHLIQRGDEVVGLDNINDYYDVNLKYDRLFDAGIARDQLFYRREIKSEKSSSYSFIKLDLIDKENLTELFSKHHFDVVCHLAAQAGVRYSIENPEAYISANIKGFLNILECCRKFKIGNLIYASSSSVYGLNGKMPFSVQNSVNHPVSLYAASKKSNELMAHAYSQLFNIPTTGLRFFTVYGPWGRPDMALFLFTKAIIDGKQINVFNHGNMKRDFTYIDDIIAGVLKVVDQPAAANLNWDGLNPDASSSSAPYRVFNIGKGSAVNLLDFVAEIERNLELKAIKNYLPMQDGDVEETWADITDLQNTLKYQPKVSVEEGVKEFVNWYKDYYAKVYTEVLI